MKHVIVYAALVVSFFLSAGGEDHENEKQDANLFPAFSEKQYTDLVRRIVKIHRKGPHTYYKGELASDEELLISEMKPTIIVVHHNRVDLLADFGSEDVVGLSFSRTTGVWSPRNTLWAIRAISPNGVEPRTLFSTNYGLTDREMKQEDLYREFIGFDAEN